MRAARFVVLALALAACGQAVRGCGFGDVSCYADDPNAIQVGVWLCNSMTPEDCGCSGWGCENADAFRTYRLATDGSDNTCDTLGGWRDDDPNFSGIFDQTFGSIVFGVHPDDMDKVNQGDVKVNLHGGDYCTGAVAGYTFEAWDADNDAPGMWSLDGQYQIKSIRPYVDTYPDAEPGIGIKFVGWPDGHMGRPYDEITCDDDDFMANVNDGCASAIDQIFCIEPDTSDGWMEAWGADSHLDGIDFAGNTANPQGWISGFGGVPLGSFMFEVYEGRDKWNCDTNWLDFCTQQDPQSYCLAARFANADGMSDDWEGLKDTMIGETWINMGYLCDNYGQSGFCINTFDGSGDGEAGICLDSFLTGPDGNPVDQWPIYVQQVWARILYQGDAGIC